MPGLLLDRVTKYYPSSGVLANDEASLEVSDGEIHAIVGENGAGKTTLMRILCGLERADSGHIELDGVRVEVPSPHAAARLGIGIVQQHFTTVPEFSVAENLALGDEPRKGFFFYDRAAAIGQARRAIEENGFHLDPEAPAASLGVGERQQLEIVKLLCREARLLVLDEPTSALAEQEIRSLFATLRRLRAAGKTVILITHKIREVLEISDSVTVMRHGRTVGRIATTEVDEARLAALVMGADFLRSDSRKASSVAQRGIRGGAFLGDGVPAFEMRDVSWRARGKAHPGLESLSLAVRRGEILGLCAVAGNGLDEVEDLAAGLARPGSGEVLVEGKPLARFRRPGLGYVPADRVRRGACLDASLVDNLIALDRAVFFPRGLVDRRAARKFALASIEDFAIKANPGDRFGSLSGGTMQKAILARELRDASSFLLASNPTWGLDVASAWFVHDRIVRARDRGAAILLISANLDELLALSDRVSVLYRGRLVCDLANGPELTQECLGEYMLGLKDDFASRRAR
jgi:ABC-type uncharacterized transport system ATPase subunit